jgi:hypothetical protein
VRIGPLLGEDDADWTRPYNMTCGAAYMKWREAGPIEIAVKVMLKFHTIVVRDRIDPRIAHEAFLVIDEYRWLISPDAKGAEDQPDAFATALAADLETLRKRKGPRRD